MTNMSKFTLFVAVIGLLVLLNNIMEQNAKANIQARSNPPIQIKQITYEQDETESDITPNTFVNNIYQTNSGSFYFVDNEISKTESQYLSALASSSHFKVQVTGPILRATVTQVFSNQTDEWQHGLYVFPLPSNAVVDSLSMRIDERVIVGKILEKDMARRSFEAAKDNGQQASLVSQLRPNMFQNEVSHIPPNAEIVVEIEFQQILRFSEDGYEFRLPTAITPRYAPEVKPSENGAEEIPSIYPNLRENHELHIELDLNMGFPLENVESLHHKILKEQANEVQYYIKTQESVNNTQEFVMRWRPKHQSHTQISHIQQSQGNEKYGIISLLAPEQIALVQARDISFILDTSGSMVGPSIEQAKAALSFAIKDLHPNDRFNIVEFNSDAKALWGTSYVASDSNIKQALHFVDRLEADGGTEILSALDLAFSLQSHSQQSDQYLKQIVFITDGSVSNEAEILAKLHNELGESRLFTIGIGNAPNAYFMTEAALIGKGTFTFIGDINNVDNEMRSLLAKIKRAVLTEVSVNSKGDYQIEILPSKLPDLYAGEPLHLFYKLEASDSDLSSQELALQINAKKTKFDVFGKVQNVDWERIVNPNIINFSTGIDKQWANQKIRQIKRKLHTSASYGDDYKALHTYSKKLITELAIKHQIVSDYTSLVAIDKTPIREFYDISERQSNGAFAQKLAQTATNSRFLNLWGLFILLVAAIGIAIGSQRVFKNLDE